MPHFTIRFTELTLRFLRWMVAGGELFDVETDDLNLDLYVAEHLWFFDPKSIRMLPHGKWI